MHSGQILNELKKKYNNGDYILENQICRNVANCPVQAYLEDLFCYMCIYYSGLLK